MHLDAFGRWVPPDKPHTELVDRSGSSDLLNLVLDSP